MVMEADHRFSNSLSNPTSTLLELAANDDLLSFKLAVESSNLPLDATALWYSRRLGGSMAYEQRTPLMVAALYGSLSVLRYILSSPSFPSAQINRPAGSDRATALHLAVSGCTTSSPLAVEALLAYSADPNYLDSQGRRPSDLIPTSKPYSSDLARKLRVLFNCPNEIEPQPEPSSPEKRDFSSPSSAAMPDINAGIYGSDEFRMYSFKIKPCSRAYTHDWTECPFAHPGENARRRDPRRHGYTCVPCPEFKKGTCKKADDCEYAHGVFESWLHPAQYKTRLCKDETGCARKVCFFAHRKDELRPVYASTGSAIPSSMDPGMFSTSSTPPVSPSPGHACSSPKHPTPPPTLQFPGGSRLRSSLCARDLDLGMEFLRLENQIAQQKKQSDLTTLTDEVYAGGRIGDFNPVNLDAAAFGSLMTTTTMPLSPMKDAQLRQNLKHLRNSYPAPSRKLSPNELDCSSPNSSSVATAMLNFRAAALAFAKRSQSFIDRGAMTHVNRYNLMGGAGAGVPSPVAQTNTLMSNWGSADGKLDWSVQGEDLSKLRRSASFGIRGGGGTRSNGSRNGNSNGGGKWAAAEPFKGSMVNEPDVTWVNTLVRDVPSSGVGQETRSPWADHLYIEQEQMVA